MDTYGKSKSWASLPDFDVVNDISMYMTNTAIAVPITPRKHYRWRPSAC